MHTDSIDSLKSAYKPSRSVLLMNVEEPYRELMHRLVDGRALRAVELASEDDVAAGTGDVDLVVLGADPDVRRCCDRVRALRRRAKDAPVVVLTRSLGVEAAVRLMRIGAADVIEMPVPHARLRSQLLAHLRTREDPASTWAILGQSTEMHALRRFVSSVAVTHCTVLLTGETGTGKGLVAKEIHCSSPRAAEAFVHVDCTALSASVIESELFGHERGSFTGAVSQRVGRFELASRGTIFLDEIGDMEPQLQAKLLRVLHDREYERIGGTRTLPMTARVIAATNQDLRVAMEEGRFRSDLYFRLQVFEHEIAPLRSRPGDIPELAQGGLASLAQRLEVEPPAMTPAFLERLVAHPWPGNVRELMNLLERLLVQFRGETLDARHFDLCTVRRAISRGSGGPRGGEQPAPDESDDGSLIAATLIATGGNVSRAARRLNLPRSTLRYRIRRHNLRNLIPSD